METISDEDKKLELAIIYNVMNICKGIAEQRNLHFDCDVIKLIGEIVSNHLRMWGKDLEHFTKHAKRSLINVDDVKLLVRHSPSLLNVLFNKTPNPSVAGPSKISHMKEVSRDKQTNELTDQKQLNVLFNKTLNPSVAGPSKISHKKEVSRDKQTNDLTDQNKDVVAGVSVLNENDRFRNDCEGQMGDVYNEGAVGDVLEFTDDEDLVDTESIRELIEHDQTLAPLRDIMDIL